MKLKNYVQNFKTSLVMKNESKIFKKIRKILLLLSQRLNAKLHSHYLCFLDFFSYEKKLVPSWFTIFTQQLYDLNLLRT